VRRWLIVSTQTTKRYFEGIVADSAEDALAQWMQGAGELNQDLTTTLPWEQRVEEVWTDA
jgi:hypothetical protein